MFSDDRITKFQELYKKRFGQELTKEDAYEKAAKLLRAVQLTYKPITEKEYRDWQERQKSKEKQIFDSGYDTDTLSSHKKG